MCGVVKRDGKPCGSWFDKRISDVCDYHVQQAVQRCRAGRPEFSVGCVFQVFMFSISPTRFKPCAGDFFIKKNRTSGMSMGSSSQKRKAAYDPQRKWGLAPANNGSAVSPSPSSQVDAGGPTYVVAGHIVAGVAGGKHDMFLKESLGREAQARAARRTNSHDTDVALKRLLARDKEGMKAVQEARRFAMKAKKRQGGKAVVRKEDESDVGDDDDESSGTGDDEENYGDDGGALADRPRPTTTTTITKSTKNAYSARVIKELGFDPTAKSFRGSHGRHKEEGQQEEKEKEDSRNKIYFEVLSVSPLSTAACAQGCSRNVFFCCFLFS